MQISTSTQHKRRSGWREGVDLALRDLSHDGKTSLVLMCTIAAIIAPILLLFGLKNGIVTSMIDTLLKDPRNLQVVVYGNTNLDRAWFTRYASHHDVAFIIPKTRTISATMDLTKHAGTILAAVALIPTALGDPLLPSALPPLKTTQLFFTQTLAQKLDVRLGDAVTGIVRRITEGHIESMLLDLHVVGIVPEAHFAGDAAFCHLHLLVRTEDYRDGLTNILSTQQLNTALDTTARHFANARIYAKDLAGVSTLAAAMRADGIEIRTQAERIHSVLALTDTLAFVFRVIAIIGVLGGMLTLGGALWVNVDRKRRSLALLRLYGFGNITVVLMPLVQSLTIAISGLCIAYCGYLAGATTFNTVLGQNLAGLGYVCRLEVGDLLKTLAVIVLVTLLAAVAAGYRAARIDAAECLREVY